MRAMPVPAKLVGVQWVQTRKRQPVEQARTEAWKAEEPDALRARCELEPFPKLSPSVEKLAFAREPQRDRQRSCLNTRSRSCRHWSGPWKRQSRKPGW